MEICISEALIRLIFMCPRVHWLLQKEFLITLDRRPLKTPGRNTISLPSYPLALAVAAEWQRQVKSPFHLTITSFPATHRDLLVSKFGFATDLCHVIN